MFQGKLSPGEDSEERGIVMTRYRRLKIQPVKARGSICGVFAGMCAVLLVSCALAGLAMSVKGAEFATISLVDHDGTYKWRVQDRDLDPTTTSTWTARKPVVEDDGHLSFALNMLSPTESASDLYTVYMVWYGSLDLSDASTITASISMTYSEQMPTLVCRNVNDPFTAWSYEDDAGATVYYTPHVRLHFLSTTGDFFDCWDYWWCEGETVYLSFTPGPYTMSWTIVASLNDLDAWTDWGGHTASSHSDLFDEAVGEVRMIGLAFGGNDYGANGVAILNSESAVTFELKSYAIA